MSEKTAIITGGPRGIGRCIVRRFLNEGYKVYAIDIDKDELEHTASSHLKKYTDSGKLKTAVCDLSKHDDIRSKIKDGAEFLGGRIDALVNDAGIAAPHWKDGATMESEDTLSQWQAYLDVNLTGPFITSQTTIPYMKVSQADKDSLRHGNSDPGPAIIHIGSFRSQQSDPNQEGYASTKAGLIGLTHAMAVSLGPLGIRVNYVAPGTIKAVQESKAGDEAKGDDAKDKVEKPSGAIAREGRPDDIADAVLYMVGARFVTGQELVVDGGALKIKGDDIVED